MKIFMKQNVYEVALDRIRYLFDEFESVTVCFSGGKDSTVTLQLALIVAEEKGRLPLNVMFVDQEAEWGCVIDYIREVMSDPRIKPYWLQVPIKIFNATSHDDRWLNCWAEGEEWIRHREPNSITENKYGTDRFKHLFKKFSMVEFKGMKACQLGGVRCEESPARTVGLTIDSTYKHITYGKIIDKKIGHYIFYPLYDWTYKDIWKAIHDNKWLYCKLYDFMYQQGVRINDMRVSNVHHETALNALSFLQELEPETWNAIVKRVGGINTLKHLGIKQYTTKKLPYMFASWAEYRDYLLEHMIPEDLKHHFKKSFKAIDALYTDEKINEKMMKECVISIIINDYELTKIGNALSRPEIVFYRKWKTGLPMAINGNPYIVDVINKGGSPNAQPIKETA